MADVSLYPPILLTYLPAIVKGSDTGNIPFSIPSYLSGMNINTSCLMATFRHQNTNESALPTDIFPSGVATCSIQYGGSGYSIDVSNIVQYLNYNEYYKVQLRFINASAAAPDYPSPTAAYIKNNLESFSEWSTVGLLRIISEPSIVMDYLKKEEVSYVSSSDFVVTGRLVMSDSSDTETLDNFVARLYNGDSQELLVDTGTVYPNKYGGVNNIYYDLEYNFSASVAYRLEITATTKDNYTFTDNFEFFVNDYSYNKIDATIASSVDKENGRIGITVKGLSSGFISMNLSIRRSESTNNFNRWEDVYNLKLDNEPLDFTWYDCTVESGVWYKYEVQQWDSNMHRGAPLILQAPVMIDLENSYLTGGDKQFNLKFDTVISSYKHAVVESITTTVGSKYPYITRNNAVDYRTFPISGTISHFVDKDAYLMRASRKELYKDSYDLYDNFNAKNNIDDYNDYIYEHAFREKVISYLYENKVRLFRSATEGNVLVKLTDISFTPDEVLGRYIYHFSATATEVDACTIKNYQKYNILPMENLSAITSTNKTVLGQLFNITVPAGQDVVTITLANKYGKKNLHPNNLKNLRIECLGQPYLISIVDGRPTPSDEKPIALGYLADINNNRIIIGKDGIYKTEGVINHLSFPVATPLILDYQMAATSYTTESITPDPVAYNYITKIGQKWGPFKLTDSLYNMLQTKYRNTFHDKTGRYLWKQHLLSIKGAKIHALPGTVVYVKEVKDAPANRHVVNQTGLLDFNAEGTEITDITFGPIHFEPATPEEAKRLVIPDGKFLETYEVVESQKDIKNPIKNGVYSIGTTAATSNGEVLAAEQALVISEEGFIKLAATDPFKTECSKLIEEKFKEQPVALGLEEQMVSSSERQIYYNGGWYRINSNNDIDSDVSAIIDYTCELFQGRYSNA